MNWLHKTYSRDPSHDEVDWDANMVFSDPIGNEIKSNLRTREESLPSTLTRSFSVINGDFKEMVSYKGYEVIGVYHHTLSAPSYPFII